MEKYYTPVKEEFHIGFEYEAKPKGSEFVGYLHFTWQGENSLQALFHTSSIIVKHLDREDIESFGFNTEDNGTCYNKQDGFTLYGIYPWEWEKGIKNAYKITIENDDVFIGIIKSKSELKRLLIQLGIK